MHLPRPTFALLAAMATLITAAAARGDKPISEIKILLASHEEPADAPLVAEEAAPPSAAAAAPTAPASPPAHSAAARQPDAGAPQSTNHAPAAMPQPAAHVQPLRMLPTATMHPAAAARPQSEPPLSIQAHQALDFYGGHSARATLSQMPRRPPIRPNGPQPARRPVKPFQNVMEEPTISPYLNLYLDENDAAAAPNYYAFVRPQIEQIETNRAQQREIQRLRAQLHNMSAAGTGPPSPPATAPGTGTAARYMDTAQFYSHWDR